MLPELEVSTKYEYCDHDGGWEDASHLLNNSMIGPSGTLQGCGARCSDNYSEGEDEWEDASHLLHDTEGGPSGHLQGCGAGCAHASDDWSDAESVDYGDSEDECDQWSDQEEWQKPHRQQTTSPAGVVNAGTTTALEGAGVLD